MANGWPRVRQPLLLNISLPKCGTLSVHKYFSDFRSSHELYGHSFLSVLDSVQRSSQPGLLQQLLRRRYQQGGLEVDASGFLHAISGELIRLYPNTLFLRVVRDPCSWIGSYLDMLQGKAQDLIYEGRLLHDRAASFQAFYLKRLDPSLQLVDLISLPEWTLEQRSAVVSATAYYWAEHCQQAIQDLGNEKIVTCRLDQLSKVLPDLRQRIMPTPLPPFTLQIDAEKRHNSSVLGPARQQIDGWLKQVQLNGRSIEQLQACDRLYQKLTDQMQYARKSKNNKASCLD